MTIHRGGGGVSIGQCLCVHLDVGIGFGCRLAPPLVDPDIGPMTWRASTSRGIPRFVRERRCCQTKTRHTARLMVSSGCVLHILIQ